MQDKYEAKKTKSKYSDKIKKKSFITLKSTLLVILSVGSYPITRKSEIATFILLYCIIPSSKLPQFEIKRLFQDKTTNSFIRILENGFSAMPQFRMNLF